ncbi:MAG: hypothetical protein ACOCRX_04370 [Candidatus Woesearchaeota archaeon]
MTSHAMYLPEDINDEIIDDIIKLAEEYKEKTNISDIGIETGHVF